MRHHLFAYGRSVFARSVPALFVVLVFGLFGTGYVQAQGTAARHPALRTPPTSLAACNKVVNNTDSLLSDAITAANAASGLYTICFSTGVVNLASDLPTITRDNIFIYGNVNLASTPQRVQITGSTNGFRIDPASSTNGVEIDYVNIQPSSTGIGIRVGVFNTVNNTVLAYDSVPSGNIGIYINNSNNTTISNGVFGATTAPTIGIRGNDTVVDSSTFTNSTTIAISVADPSLRSLITNNTFTGASGVNPVIQLKGTSATSYVGNSLIENNTFTAASGTITIPAIDLDLFSYSTKIDSTGNHTSSMTGFQDGILVRGSSGNTIVGNTISANSMGYGIHLVGGNGSTPGADDNIIGGTGSPNILSGGKGGVALEVQSTTCGNFAASGNQGHDGCALGNAILSNTYTNTPKGIILNVNAFGSGYEADNGITSYEPNGWLDYPQVTTTNIVKNANSTYTITGTTYAPGTEVDLYQSAITTVGNQGAATALLGSAVSSAVNGLNTFSLTTTNPVTQDNVPVTTTATLTPTIPPNGTNPPNYGTSEFSPVFLLKPSQIPATPPTLSAAFTPGTIVPGDVSSLAFNLTNPNTTSALSGVAFSDSLPGGVSVANPPGVVNSCQSAGTFAPNAGDTSLNLSAQTLNISETCTIKVNVTSTTPGSVTNTVSQITTTQTGQTSLSPAASAMLTVQNYSAPTLTKAFSPANSLPNGAVSLSFSLANPNTKAALTGVGFSDTFPTGLVVNGSSLTANSCTLPLSLGSSSLTMSGGTLAAGQTCTFSASVSAAAAGSYTNTISAISSTQTGQTNPAAQAILTIYLPPTVSKAFSPTTIKAGGSANVVLTVANPNAAALTNVSLSDTLVSGLSLGNFVSSTCNSASVTPNGNAFTVAFSTIAPNQTCTVNVGVTGATPGVYQNSISSISSDQTGTTATSASASLTVLTPPTVSKAFNSSSIQSGATTTLTISIVNPNSTALTGVGLSDTFPSGLTVATPSGLTDSCAMLPVTASGGVVSVGSGTLAPNQTCTISVSVTSSTIGPVTNTITAVTTNETGTTATSASASLTVTANCTVQLVYTTQPGNATAGQIFGTQPVVDVNTPCSGRGLFSGPVSVSIKPGTGTTGATLGGTTTATLGSASGATFTNLTIDKAGTGYVLVAHLTNGSTSYTAESQPFDVAQPVQYSAPTLSKAFSPASIVPGDVTTLTFTLTNPNGSATLTGVAFSDSFQSGLTVAGTPNVGNSCAQKGTVTASAGATSISLAGQTLNAGESCTISVAVTSSTAGGSTNTVSQISSTQTGQTTLSPVASANLTVQPYSAPTVSTSFNPTSVPVNTASTLTISITNPNTKAALTGIGLTDTLPANLVVATPPNVQNPCTLTVSTTSGSVSVNGGTIAAGATCTISVNASSATATTYTNTISSIGTTQTGQVMVNATAQLTVTPVAVQYVAPTLTKKFTLSPVKVNEVTTLVFTLTNPNARPLTGVGFVDAFPTGLVVAATANATDSCSTPGSFAPGAGAGSVTVAGVGLAANESCTISVAVSSAKAASYPNSIGSIGSDQTGTTALTPPAAATLVVTTKKVADLAVTMTVDNATPAAGQTIVYTIVVTNNGPDKPSNIHVSDVLAAGLSYSKAKVSQGVYNKRTGVWSIFGIASGHTATLHLTVKVNTTAPIVNTATIIHSSLPDPNGSNNSASVTINAQTVAASVVADTEMAVIRRDGRS